MQSQIHLSPAIIGALTPADLLTNDGTIFFTIDRLGLDKDGVLFRVDDPEFVFRLGVFNTGITVQRNEFLITLTPDPSSSPNGLVPVFVTWNYNELSLRCGEKTTTVRTRPAAPPARLIKWARTENLIPIAEYSSEEEFRAKVYTCLLSLEDKIKETASSVSFWDVEYDGHTIKSRKPKREPDIHPVIHCMLSDQMLLASIEVIPEFKTGVGNLDFLFLASVKNRGISRFCAEFKHAHSNDVYRGLETQLPAYMQNANATYGAYCVLGFKGDWFDEPQSTSLSQLEFDLQVTKLKSKNPLHGNIRVLTYDLSKPATASKL